MVTLRYTVTKLKEFAAITKQDVRLKLLKAFIDKILEINQPKAAQGDPPLKAKEVYEIGKEYLENYRDIVPEARQAGFQFAGPSQLFSAQRQNFRDIKDEGGFNRT